MSLIDENLEEKVIKDENLEEENSFDITEYSVKDALKFVEEENDLDTLKEWMNAEMDGDSRVTLIDPIQDKIEKIEKEIEEEKKKAKRVNPFKDRNIMVNGESIKPGEKLPN